MLDVAGLSVAINGTPILRNVSLTVPKGAMVGLVGRNGSGKTTTMRSIIGIQRPASGSIRIGGKDMTLRRSDHRAADGVGYMPEDRRLVPELTVRENMMVPVWALGIGDSAERIRRILDLIPELQPLMDRRAPLLSGGQQKLAALGRALIVGHSFLLLDEPSEGVAPALARRIAEILSKFKLEGISVLIAESNDHHVSGLLDGVYGIERGEVAKL